jgi:hypothetical protein
MKNDDLYFRVARNIIAWREVWGPEYKKLHKEQNREDIINWGRAKLAPFLPEDQEVIPRERWDLEGLIGATEKQLCHPHYNELRDHLYDNFVPNSKTAIVMLCANKKPYSTQQYIKQYLKLSNQAKADFFILSNPGIIPISYDNHYPFRYYEWNETEETPEIKEQYVRVTKQRIQEWFDRFPYKAIVNMVRPGETLDALLDCNLRQSVHTVFSEENIRKIYDLYLERFGGSKGLLKFRMLGLTITKDLFKEQLLKAEEVIENERLFES